MITNFNQLATTPLRKQALLISEAGLSALAIRPIMQQVWYDGRRDALNAQGQKFSLAPFQHVILVGLGTGSLTAASHLAETLGSRLTAGLIIDEQEGQLPRILSRRATPHFSITNHSLTKELMALARDCAADDVIISVMTGGNDLLAAPAGMVLDDKRSIINALINSGASPAEIETVKKHLSLVKGGNLAKLSFPAAMINLIFDTQSAFSGGPTVMDQSTVHDARQILNQYNVLDQCGLASCQLFETPKEDSYFERVNNVNIPVGEYAQKAMASKAQDLGFRVAKVPSLDSVKAGEAWLGNQAMSPLVSQMPEQGVLLNFDGQQGQMFDAGSMAGARRAGLAGLAAENWAENIDTFSLADRYARAMTPLSIYLRP